MPRFKFMFIALVKRRKFSLARCVATNIILPSLGIGQANDPLVHNFRQYKSPNSYCFTIKGLRNQSSTTPSNRTARIYRTNNSCKSPTTTVKGMKQLLLYSQRP